MNEPSTDPVAAAVAILDERWPLTVDEMAAALSDRGFGDVGTLETALELGDAFDDPRIMHLSDGRFVAPRNLLEGRIWTHRLTAGEISADAIELFDVMIPVCLPSADPAMRVVMPGEESFEARGLPGVAWARLGVLLFPEGFLSETTLGDLIAVTCVGGELVVDLYPDQNAGRGSLGEWLAERAARLSDPEDALYPDTDLFVVASRPTSTPCRRMQPSTSARECTLTPGESIERRTTRRRRRRRCRPSSRAPSRCAPAPDGRTSPAAQSLVPLQDRPARVVEVEDRLGRDQVHVGVAVGVDRPDVAPVAALALGHAGNVVLGEVPDLRHRPRARACGMMSRPMSWLELSSAASR